MIAIAEVRPRVLRLLEPRSDTDPQVIGITDAVQPPCLQISWAQPWLLAQPQAPLFFARVQALAIGGRVEADGSIEQLEDLATFAIARFAEDLLPWSPLDIAAPRGLEFGGIAYLVARITYQVPVDGAKPRPVIDPRLAEVFA